MVASIHDILRELRSVAYDERDKGDRFERLMQAYLTVEPQYAQLYDAVWMWTDYPMRGTRRDTGIDLVARARDTGELTAIQCKFFDPSTTVTKPMLDSFLAASSKNLEGTPEFSGRLADKSTVIYNSGITVTGIPEEAHEYMLGSRSAIDWIIERYQVKTDNASGIVNDPNDWAEEQDDPRYILDLLARIVTVSVETLRIVNSLPPLEVLE